MGPNLRLAHGMQPVERTEQKEGATLQTGQKAGGGGRGGRRGDGGVEHEFFEANPLNENDVVHSQCAANHQ